MLNFYLNFYAPTITFLTYIRPFLIIVFNS